MVDYIIVVKIRTLKNMEARPLPKCLHCPQALEEQEVQGRTQHGRQRHDVHVLGRKTRDGCCQQSVWSDIVLCSFLKFNHSLGDCTFFQ